MASARGEITVEAPVHTRVLHRSGAFHSSNSALFPRCRRRRAQLTKYPAFYAKLTMAIHPEVLWAQRSSEIDDEKVCVRAIALYDYEISRVLVYRTSSMSP